MRVLSLAFVLIIAMVVPAVADDWANWMGPTGDGVYYEEGIIGSIPAEGLPVKWRASVAGGYAGPAVAAGRVYLFDYVKTSGEAFNDPGRRANVSGAERLICFDSTDGNKLWQWQYDCPYSISYPVGPRCTPTVDIEGPEDSGRVFTLGSEGDLHCLNAETGKLIWKRSFKEDYKAAVPIWGFASHPLVDGDWLYCMVGGPGQTVVAFDKRTGEEKWKGLSASAVGYCPPSITTFGGVRQLIVWHADGVQGVDPTTGKAYWNMPIKPDYEMAITRPQRDGNRMYASGIRTASVMFELADDRPAVKELWRGVPKQSVYCANSTPIFHQGVVYGTDCNDGALIAVDGDNGKQLWKTFSPTKPGETRFVRHGTAFLTRIDDTNRYFMMSETGELIMAELTREAYKELGRFQVVEPTSEAFGRDVVWSHPAYSGRTAFVRNDKELVAVDIAAGQAP
jgi:outer membrane protein assembly factor BamB